MRFRLLLVAFVAIAFFSGCVHTEIMEREDGSKLVEVNTTGWYLLDLLPIICGDAAEPEGGVVWFSDSCTAYSNMIELSRIIKSEQSQLKDGSKLLVGPIISKEVDEGVLVFLINRHEFRTSAVLKTSKE